MRTFEESHSSLLENLAPRALMRRAVYWALSGYVAIRSAPMIAVSALAALLVIATVYLYFSSGKPSPAPQAAMAKPSKAVEKPAATNGISQTVSAHDPTDWTDLKPAYQTYKIEINSDSSLQTDKQAIQLYGIKVLPRNQICKYRSGEKWACGQRAYIALINILGSKFADCRPHDTDRPNIVVCQLAGADIGEMMLREGWANLNSGVTNKQYVNAAAEAHKYKMGMWREMPQRTAAN